MTMEMTRPKPFRTATEFDFKAKRFRTYKICDRCDGRSQYSSKTKTPLCKDCIAVLTPSERKRWLR